MGSDGNVSNFMTDASARANGVNSVLALLADNLAFLSEVYVPSSDYGPVVL